MSIPIRNHFVPECHLRPFANYSIEFYSFCKIYRHIKSSSIGKVCYGHNYFKLIEEETFIFNSVTDPSVPWL